MLRMIVKITTMARIAIHAPWTNFVMSTTMSTVNVRTMPKPLIARARIILARAINGFGMVLTFTVLIVVLVTKFVHGAWIAILAMVVIFTIMRSIRQHYDSVHEELALGTEREAARALPSRVHAIVLVSRLHKPTMRAIAYARAARSSVLEAVTVGVDPGEVDALRAEWNALDLPVALKVLDSPYREITRPILDYVRSIRRESPRDLVVVYIPEYVVGHWWEQILHNQSALRLKSRLLFTPGVVVALVPWPLRSSELVVRAAAESPSSDGETAALDPGPDVG